jgi:hypothetical protein
MKKYFFIAFVTLLVVHVKAMALPFVTLNMVNENITGVSEQYNHFGQTFTVGYEQPLNSSTVSLTGEVGVLAGSDYAGGNLGIYTQKTQFQLADMPIGLLGLKVRFGLVNVFIKGGFSEENVAYLGDNTGNNTYSQTVGMVNGGLELQFKPNVAFDVSYFQTFAGSEQDYSYDDLQNVVTINNVPSVSGIMAGLTLWL